MAREVHKLQYTRAELDAILAKSDNAPFVIWHDEGAGVYRFFPDEERMNTWVQAYIDNEGVVPPEIDKLQFADPITAPAPNTINLIVTNDNQYILEGTKGATVDFTFETLDRNGSHIAEPIDVYYTIRSSDGTKTTSAVYSADLITATAVSMNIDKYVSLGRNTITITAKGRSTSTTKTVVATCNVFKLRLSSTFNFAVPKEPNVTFEVPYRIEGDSDRIVEFYIDGSIVANPSTSSLEGDVDKLQPITVSSVGKHNLQIVAKTVINGVSYKSKLLYFEFIITGADITTTMIAEEFSSTTDVFTENTMPGLHGEQYVVKKIAWAYYSSDPSKQHNVTIKWQLFNPGNEIIPIATRTADIAEASVSEAPEPISFMPTESGNYHLQALIDDVVINHPDYTITIIPNTSGIIEATNGLTMKLLGLGRSNSEPSYTRSTWTSTIEKGGELLTYTTTFTNQPWNDNSGWIDNALVLNGGATALINNKPFAAEVSPQTRQGCTFEIDFETFNVLSEDTELLRIGLPNKANLVITTNKAVLTTDPTRKTIVSRFKADERIKIAFVVYPYDTTEYHGKMFVYNNGVMSGVVNYNVADNFDMGRRADTSSQEGMIQLGDSSGNAGIKIYAIRTYDNYISMYEELNNYFIDSGEDLVELVANNDIYSTGKFIDVDKLESTITTVKITGSLDEIIGTGTKDNKLICALEVTSPIYPNIYLTCAKAQINKAGQSTLEKPVPSFHVKLDPKGVGNVCYDRDGKVYAKNRWAFREGNVPEKKFRLQANYMDSSGCHNAAFFRLYNKVAPRVQIENKNVLRIPAEVYATETYPTEMYNRYKDEYPDKTWKFPYTINITPDSIPCVVVYRPTNQDSYRFLGQYVIMEEKKANYANGMHSIYSGIDYKGNEDPFGFRAGEKQGVKLWDNVNCHQMEFLRSASMLDFLCDDSQWNDINPSTGTLIREDSFELIYPDEDDLTPAEIDAEWTKFYNDVVHPICSTYDPEHPEQAQAAFNDLFYGSNPKLDRWGFAAYYCLVLRHACSDSLVRNMELVTYDGQKWTPKWWDVDMQCGLQQSGACDIQPGSTRETKISPVLYALSGRIIENGVLKSSWLWDGLEGCEQFKEDVKTMDDALYKAGWNYQQVTKIQDEEYIDAWSEALYNESGVTKYLTYGGTDDLNYISLQGDRTPHRHWFLRTSFDYFDALNVCGEYTVKACKAKTAGINSSGPNNHVYIVPSSDSYFGWRYTTDIVESAVFIEKGETGFLTISRPVTSQEFIVFLGANKIAEMNFSEIFTNFYAAIDFSDAYDDVLGSQFRKIILGSGDGATKTKLNSGLFNTNNEANVIGGLALMSKLEYLDIQGMHSFTSIDLTHNGSLKKFYAAGTNITTFDPANGSNLVDVELPTTITSMTMNSCNLEDSNHHCLISWYKTNYTNDEPSSVTSTTVPSTLINLSFTNMGTDKGVQELVFDWLNAINNDYVDPDSEFEQRYIYCNNVNWIGVSKSDLMLLAKIPSFNNRRRITGYIKCSDAFTNSDIVAIQAAFGRDVFTDTPGVPLRIDAESGFILGCPDEILAGNSADVSAVVFPISQSSSIEIAYELGTYTGDNYTVLPNSYKHTDESGTYYEYNTIKLYTDTGRIVTIENQTPDYDVGVKGFVVGQVYNNGTVRLTVKKRTYPTSADINLTFTEGKLVKKDTVTNVWYITDKQLYVYLTGSVSPSEYTGTLLSRVWTKSSSIDLMLGVYNQNENQISYYINTCGPTETSGTITYTENYVGGYSVSKVITVKLKDPVLAIHSNVNNVLQTALVSAGIAHSQIETYDVELWGVRNFDSLDILSSGSTLEHFAEINEFKDLTITTLDMSNCTSAGSIDSPILLEDQQYHYVDILPAKDRTLAFNFTTINLANTYYKGVNIKDNSSLQTITYSSHTTEVNLINQSSLSTVNILTSCASVLESIVIKNCSTLTGITWN